MPNLITDLTNRLADPGESGLDAGLLVPLLRLLVDGDPVSIEELAAAAGRTVDDVRRGLAAVPDTEYDAQGRILGQGLTLRPTNHRFTVAGEELYTWCALDTLIFPALVERALGILRRDLAGVMLPPNPASTAVRLSGQLTTDVSSTNTLDGSAERITPDIFTNSGRIDGWSSFADVQMVSYYLAPAADGGSTRDLVRVVTRNLLPVLEATIVTGP